MESWLKNVMHFQEVGINPKPNRTDRQTQENRIKFVPISNFIQI